MRLPRISMTAGLPRGLSFRYRISRPSMRQLWLFQSALGNHRSSRFGTASMQHLLVGRPDRPARLQGQLRKQNSTQFDPLKTFFDFSHKLNTTRIECILTTIKFNGTKMPGSGNPLPKEILDARKRLGLTQTQAAAMLHTTCRVWQQWESGKRKMHPAFWELFTVKALLNARSN